MDITAYNLILGRWFGDASHNLGKQKGARGISPRIPLVSPSLIIVPGKGKIRDATVISVKLEKVSWWTPY
jgi:hypothetical protein